LYVDHILIASNSKHEVIKVKYELNNEFGMKDLGAARKILGIKISKQRGLKHLNLSHETYHRKTRDKFDMKNLKPVSTPLASHYKLSDEQSFNTVEEQLYMDGISYGRKNFVREKISCGSVKVVKVSTGHNPSDMITKVVLDIKFFHCLNLIQLMGD